MVTLLVALAALALGVLAFLSIAFYVSCIHERERRASALAAVMSGVVLVVLVRFLAAALEGFFDTQAGVLTLAAICAVLAIGGFLFVRRTAPNARALAGTQGRIEGEVKRFDERDQVFSPETAPSGRARSSTRHFTGNTPSGRSLTPSAEQSGPSGGRV
jgi:hypothetical protein